MSEPKEWELLLSNNSNEALVAQPGEIKYWTGIHVIEKSAYSALLEQAEALAIQLDKEIKFMKVQNINVLEKSRLALEAWHTFKGDL